MGSWLGSVWCENKGRANSQRTPSLPQLLIIVIGMYFSHLLSISPHGEGQLLPLAKFHLLEGLASEGSLCNPICTMGC